MVLTNGGIMEDNKDINNYINALLTDKLYLNEQFDVFAQNYYTINEIYNNTIKVNILNNLLKEAKRNYKLRSMLGELLLYADGKEISESTFRLIDKFDKKTRNNCYFALSHCKLSFFQNYRIYRTTDSLEAFCILFDTICKYGCFVEDDVYIFLQESHVNGNALKSCINAIKAECGMSPKLLVAETYLEKTNKNN